MLLLSGNNLKVIAAIFMVIDHIGVMLFPDYIIFRILGRISFPIFAFMIAEGCYYTKNKLRYFLSVFCLGVLCQGFYYVFDGTVDFCILITFSLSILLIYLFQNFKKQVFAEKISVLNCILHGIICVLYIIAVHTLCQYFYVDYGFWGVLAPVFACIFRNENDINNEFLKKTDDLYLNIIIFGIGLTFLAIAQGLIQFYSLFSLIFLFLYSGKRGKRKMKYFFYIFYPLHFVILQLIALLIN